MRDACGDPDVDVVITTRELVRMLRCSMIDPAALEESSFDSDVYKRQVKWQKENKEFLITRNMLSLMEKGSVIVDISNDEPGAIETSRATTHEDPRYIVDGIVHYCVANIPGAVAHSASVAYAAQMLPLILHPVSYTHLDVYKRQHQLLLTHRSPLMYH